MQIKKNNSPSKVKRQDSNSPIQLKPLESEKERFEMLMNQFGD